jgi:hypothetical protein
VLGGVAEAGQDGRAGAAEAGLADGGQALAGAAEAGAEDGAGQSRRPASPPVAPGAINAGHGTAFNG